LRVGAPLCGGRRAWKNARTHGVGAGQGRRGHPPDPKGRPEQGRCRAATLADDRPQVAQGLDGPQGRRRPADRRHIPCAPGAAPRGRGPPRPREASRELDEELQGRGAFRQERAPHPGARRTGAKGRAPDGIESPHQRRRPFAGPADAGFPRPRRECDGARRGRRPGHAHLGQVSARCSQTEPGPAQFPDIRSG